MVDESPEKAPRKIALEQLLERGNFDVTIKSTEHEDDGKILRIKDLWLFRVALVVALIMFAVCLGVLLWGTPGTDDKRWLQSILGLIVGGLIGAAFKR